MLCKSYIYMFLHKQRCVECNGSADTCGTRPGTIDGPGVPDADLIIYVAADCTGRPNGVVAFAGACQLESELDR